MSSQQRTVHVNAAPAEAGDETGTVAIAAFGHIRRLPPGRSVLETLLAAGVTPPGPDQTVKVSRRGTGSRGDVVTDLNRVLEAGETVAITHNVRGGLH